MEKKRYLLNVYCVNDSNKSTKNKKIELEQFCSDDIKEIYSYIDSFELEYVYMYTIYDFVKKIEIDSYENPVLTNIF